MTLRVQIQAEPIPGYRLIERLGVGGFGEVWKCEAPGGLLKAIKFVQGSVQDSGPGEIHAQQELRALNRVKSVRHPYILSLERYDIIDGQLVIVMELADRSLWDRFKECRNNKLPGIPRDELLRYLEETAEALDLMTAQYQLQHLDIKPQNLFLVYNHVKVADFGLVKDLAEIKAHVTSGITPLYAAPETFDGIITPYCDQYSLAIVYQELLTGQRPFNGSNARQLLMQHVSGTPDLDPLPASERPAIARALAKKPTERFPSCTDLIQALRQGPAAAAMPGVGRVSPAAHPLLTTPVSGARDSVTTKEEVSVPASVAVEAADVPAEQFTLNVEAAPEVSPSDAEAPTDPQPGRARVQAIRARLAEAQPPPQPARPPRPEQQGDGVLFPALVIGIGHLGLNVLGQLRRTLQERCGPLSSLPHIRVLHLDTDPRRMRDLVNADGEGTLSDSEVVVARLNRPVHYLKPTHGRPRMDAWLNPKLLYRIPRDQSSTEGVRALGRLAFIDNYPAIEARLDAQLESCTAPSALAAAKQNTQLGLRTTRPRVYVVVSLAGGTGSGMFLDMAYVVRHKLKLLGYENPDVVALLLVPPPCFEGLAKPAEVADSPSASPLTPPLTPAQVAAGNAFAALTELNHYSAPETSFVAQYGDGDWPITDPEPPFGRCIVLPLPPESRGPAALREIVVRAGDFLVRDLTTPLGRAADDARCAQERSDEHPTDDYRNMPSPRLRVSTFGLHWVSWPRRALVHRVARRLCAQLTHDWLLTGRPGLRESIQAWIADQWQKHQLTFEACAARLQAECEQALGQSIEALFATVTAPLGEAGLLRASLDPTAAVGVLEQLRQLVGRPTADSAKQDSGEVPIPTVETLTPQPPSRKPVLAEALSRAGRNLRVQAERQLAELIVCLMDAPTFHLAGAEEALAQIRLGVEHVLESQQAVCDQLGKQAAEVNARIQALLFEIERGATWWRRKGRATVELVEAIRLYPTIRYRELVLQKVINVQRHLLESAAERQREVEFCRNRLQNFSLAFQEPSVPSGTRQRHVGAGQYLLPDGCRSLSDAVRALHQAITPEDLLQLDRQAHQAIQRQFQSLLQVCISVTDLFKDLEACLARQAENFVSDRLGAADVVEVYLNGHANEERARGDIAGLFDEAVPEAAVCRHAEAREVSLLALPPGESSERLRQLATEALPDVQMIPAASSDEIVLYRERMALPLAQLPQLGSECRAAYERLSASEQFTPHIRTDIFQWLPVGEL